jgi:hypothetical protein
MAEGSQQFRITRYSPEPESRVRYDGNKFAELVLYIAHAFKNDKRFGRIKLAKLIFNSDLRAMQHYGRPITGVTYIKDTWGHNPVQLLNAELDLEYEDLVTIIRGEEGEDEPRVILPRDRQRLVPKRQGHPDYPDADLQIVDSVIEDYRYVTAKQMSDEAHEMLSWQLPPKMKQEIPLETLLIGKPTERDLQASEKVAAQLGLLSE